MRSVKYFLFLILFFVCGEIFSQTTLSNNILLIHSNAPVQFDKVEASTINTAVSGIIQITDTRVKEIIAGQTGKKSLLAAYDLLTYDLNDLGNKLGLIAQTYESENIRNAANSGIQVLSDYGTSLILNEPLYKALKVYAAKSLTSLKPNEQKFLNEQIQLFENNGMKLDINGRKDLQTFSNKITQFGLMFDKNIGTSRDSIIFTGADLVGVPDNDKKGWETAQDQYTVYVNTPNLFSIRNNADLDATRRIMYYKYNNRAYPQNMAVLDSLLYYRSLYAKKLGYKSYAEYALTTKMAETPSHVWKFENNLIEKLTPANASDLASLRAIKHAMHPELPDTIYTWDVAYYKKKLLDSKYNLNEEEVRQYFEMDQTISGMFEVYHRLLGITVKETSGVPTWYYKVRSFEMYVGDKKVGNFYFDLYPRQNKYTHFACFGISSANITGEKEILPVAALICNFPEPVDKDQPTLLDHADVTTLFHEFGHLVHFMVVRSNLSAQPGTLKSDFVEAPSQFLENFCWSYESLKIFARNYKTGALMPESLFNKLKATQYVLEANTAMRQLWLGLTDFTFEDKYDSIRGKNLGDVEKNLYAITQIPYQEGTHSITSFTHLNGYAANYYGYMWSKVFAQDIFSVFEKNGVMDPKTGERYRKQILEVAGSKQEMDLLRDFLGREPNSDAFMKSIGL